MMPISCGGFFELLTLLLMRLLRHSLLVGLGLVQLTTSNTFIIQYFTRRFTRRAFYSACFVGSVYFMSSLGLGALVCFGGLKYFEDLVLFGLGVVTELRVLRGLGVLCELSVL
jgi:hypothetical protein